MLGQWSYQRELRKTPVEEVISGEKASVTSKDNSAPIAIEKEKEASAALGERSVEHAEGVDDVSPVVSDFEDDPDNPAEVPQSSAANNDLTNTAKAAFDGNEVTDVIIVSENPQNIALDPTENTEEPSEKRQEVDTDDQDNGQKESQTQSDTE
jgi:hypothetical protein